MQNVHTLVYEILRVIVFYIQDRTKKYACLKSRTFCYN